MAIRQFRSTSSITDRSSISMKNYLREVNKYPLLSADQEVELARKVQEGGIEGEKAKKKLIEGNLRFVITIANKFHCKGMELSDLISEGNIGLIKAAERFDETKGFKFVTFAIWWIRQSITRAIEMQGGIVRIPHNQLETLRLYDHLSVETEQKEHRKPTDVEFADYAGIGIEKAKKLININQKAVSADQPIGKDDNIETTLIDMFASENSTDSLVDEESLHLDLVRTMLCVLNECEREVIERSFGIDRMPESLNQIAVSMHFSRERIRQIHELAINKMRDGSHLLYGYLG